MQNKHLAQWLFLILCLGIWVAPLGAQPRIETFDTVFVDAEGGATLKRFQALVNAEHVDRHLDSLLQRHLISKLSQLPAHAKSQEKCQFLISESRLWDACRVEEYGIYWSKTWLPQNPLSRLNYGQLSFDLQKYLAQPMVHGDFMLIGLGAQYVWGPKAEQAMRLRESQGFVWNLVVQFPGPIQRVWGQDVRGDSQQVQLNLLNPWPVEQEPFIVAEDGRIPFWLLSLMGIMGLWIFVIVVRLLISKGFQKARAATSEEVTL